MTWISVVNVIFQGFLLFYFTLLSFRSKNKGNYDDAIYQLLYLLVLIAMLK